MNLSAEHLAELLAGIARAQSAIIDAVERANGGWRNSHLLPLLTIAANMRTADPRLLDLPARILLRAQGRGAVDVAAVVADLERLTGAQAAPAAAAPAPATATPTAPAVAKPASELDVSKPA